MTFSIDPCDPCLTVVEKVDPDAFVKKLIQREIDEDEERKKGYNPMKEKKERLSIAQELERIKPEGSTYKLTVDGLEHDTVYEFKISLSNRSGESMYSDPSHRAKTNRAVPPDPATEFILTEIIPQIHATK